jgi:hypothetical protein
VVVILQAEAAPDGQPFFCVLKVWLLVLFLTQQIVLAGLTGIALQATIKNTHPY